MNKNFKLFLIFLFVFVIARGLMQGPAVPEVSYSEFQRQLTQGNLSEVTVHENSLTATLKDPQDGKKELKANLVPKDLAELLNKHGVNFKKVVEENSLEKIIISVLPILILLGAWFFIIRKGMDKNMGGTGGLQSIGKSRAKIYVETDTKLTFNDVAGADEALEELREVIDFLKNSEKIKRLGGKMPKGVLLVGPPGTGKTLIAKAIAGEAGVPFYSTNGAEFVEMFVGVGAARVRDLFEQAKKSAPCIIFIDELDALGKVRHVSPVSGNDEKEQTLNQLLVEMDGFDARSGIIIISATNRPEIIDPALLRAGRFDRQVLIDRPDKKGRSDILKIHTRKITMSPEVKLDEVAGLTTGFSGADLANLVNEAALIATRENADEINMAHFTNALERIIAGLQRKNRVLNKFERQVVAHHEMGHALAGRAFSRDGIIHKVSIIPRGIGSLGYTIQRPTEDRYLMTKEELESKMTVLLAGRAAEVLSVSQLSTGAADDLARASDIAREMVMRYGMSQDLGLVSYEDSTPTFLNVTNDSSKRAHSEKTAQEIDENVKSLVMSAYHRAHNFLKENRSLLESSAQLLLNKETLSEAELGPIFSQIIYPQEQKIITVKSPSN